MTEKPILFSGEMVRAILSGRKTQTRRVVKLPAIRQDLELLDIVKHGEDEWLMKVEDENLFVAHLGDEKLRIKCPYGVPGDRLWVRETFYRTYYHQYGKTFYRADGKTVDIDCIYGGTVKKGKKEGLKWRPSTNMPREYSRITLEVTGVRVERVQEISAEDARDEGIPEPYVASEMGYQTEMTGQFKDLWNSINAKRPGCSWKDNPWCWVVEFKRVEE